MTRIAPFVVLVLSAAIVGVALLSQYWGRLVPCELCLYERWPYYAVIALTALALLVGRRGTSRAALALAALIFVVGAVLAFYHVGVEQHWFTGPSACTAAPLGSGSVADLRKQLLATPVVRCDEVQWSFAGVSLAGLNLLGSVLMAVVSWRAMTRMAAA
ncbi:MAG: disulfide bond formation protein B [Stellaceae bacterium]